MIESLFNLYVLLIPNSFVIREGTTKVKLFQNFKEQKSFKPEFGAEGTIQYSNSNCCVTDCQLHVTLQLCSVW